MKKKSLGRIAFETHTIATDPDDRWEYIKREHPHFIKYWNRTANAIAREVKRRMKGKKK